VRSAGDWNDLAASGICAARDSAQPERWLAALAAVDEALALDPLMPAARFNRALIVDSLGVTPVARAQWQRYLSIDDASAWSRIAHDRIASYRSSETDSWKAATARLSVLTEAALENLTDRYPQPARKYAEAIYLSRWAAALVGGGDDPSAAEAELRVVRVVARTLARRGEPLLADAVSAIDRASGHERANLATGQLRYQEGRLKLRAGNPAGAETDFRAAGRLFARENTPMAGVAEFWTACALTEQHMGDEARDVLASLLARPYTARYPSLFGSAQYQLSLLESWHGNWSDSLAASIAAHKAFSSLGERGNAANASAMLSESYDLLGQPELAWKHGFEALRDSVADGALDRARVALAGLCRTELRGKRWDRARSIVRLEAELAPLAPDPRLEPDMWIRSAAAEWHLQKEAAGRRSMRLARVAVGRIADPTMRAKLVADVDAAEGSIIRSRDPRRALTLLASAIAFQRGVARPIVLPELYLQRGRAFMALQDLPAAKADFDLGLVELERQRSRVSDVELRPGIFEDAAELFDEAIALQLTLGADADVVFRYVERGRARAVLEQIRASDDTPAPAGLPSIRDIQRKLGPGVAVVEYASLPERTIALVIANDRAALRVMPVSRARLAQLARDLTAIRGASGSTLDEALIAPLREDLRGVSALNIVADDTVQRIPFAALFDRANRTFLAQKYLLATSPSAAVLLTTIARTGRRAGGGLPTALVFANPTIPREEFGNLPQLSGADFEAENVASSYGTAETHAGDAATAERFLRLAPAREVVHFAGHGENDEREPYSSALVCAASPRRNGAVTAREIARTRFHRTRTVVLAACSTMTGRNAAIEGVPTLSRAFLIGGVPAVIGTLWDIEDREAAEVIRTLHRHLGRGAPADVALRRAQLDAIQRNLPPSQWSAFALMGSAGTRGDDAP
jgi:CHAT domain-containing protein